ncbi:hypothetical protein TSUD_403520 [Trifolium subterraneum]|uniref:RRM domain-containing protein n=1 Tax=Trifolium subterraneum TaxID=3900 RepID=A0A2Z6NSV2_TRISU|nr:hypothetical protein TSUD_403520 [Trifolium subterraneum]
MVRVGEMRDDDYEWQEVRRRRNNMSSNNVTVPDIATIHQRRREDETRLTTYFFSDIPDNFGAKAMLNIFQKYGDVVEVVIPAKRDKGGRRFEFARFEQVSDVRKFGIELDNIIIGRDKIYVNLSRFQREQRNSRYTQRDGGHVHAGWKERHEHYAEKKGWNQETAINRNDEKSYAHAVKGGKPLNQQKLNQTPRWSYTTGKDTLLSLQKTYVGEVLHSGMSYNIQDEFHRQGSSIFKVSMFLSFVENLSSVVADMSSAAKRLKESDLIQPWSTREVDSSRLVWLRVYGIPVHAWNAEFFVMITKPYREFINEDEGTLKRITLDVARIMIRTEEQKVVDEIVEVKINNEIFRLRIIEDSYGPMMIMVAQDKRSDGRDAESNCSEEEEEEITIPAEDGDDLVMNAGDNNLLALTNFVNDNNVRMNENGILNVNGKQDLKDDNPKCVWISKAGNRGQKSGNAGDLRPGANLLRLGANLHPDSASVSSCLRVGAKLLRLGAKTCSTSSKQSFLHYNCQSFKPLTS